MELTRLGSTGVPESTSWGRENWCIRWQFRLGGGFCCWVLADGSIDEFRQWAIAGGAFE